MTSARACRPTGAVQRCSARQTFSPVSGICSASSRAAGTPARASASSTALTAVGVAPIVPSSPTPFTPSRLLRQGLDSWVLPAVDVAGANETVTRILRVTPPRGVTTPAVLDVTVTVEIQPIVGTARFAVPIVMQGGSPSARLSPAATLVTLAGSLSTLNAIQPSDIKARVEVGSGASGTQQLPVIVDPPANTRVVVVQPDTASVTIPAASPSPSPQ